MRGDGRRGGVGGGGLRGGGCWGGLGGGVQQPVTKDRKTGGVEERARDHPVGMTGATERGEKRRER